MLDSVSVVDNSKFQFAWIARDRMLNNKRISHFLHFRQVFEKRPDILCPEDKAIHAFWSQIDLVDLLAIRIYHHAIASLQTVHKPLTVKGRNICFIAG